MNKISAVLIPLIVLGACGCATQKNAPSLAPQASHLMGDLRKRIAVVDFVDKTEYGKGRLAAATSDILEGELQRSGNFTLVTHSGVDEILNLQAVGQSGVMDSSTAMQAGRLVGANAIINGSVSEFGIKKKGFSVPGVIGTSGLEARAVVDINLIDGTSGVILLSETAEGTAESSSTKILNIGADSSYDETLAGKALRMAIVSLTRKITERLAKMPWEGFVLSREGRQVFVTGGSDVGLDAGMEFEVRTAGRQVTAPNGRSYLLPGETKGRLRIASVLDDIAQGDLIQGAADKNDIVRFTR